MSTPDLLADGNSRFELALEDPPSDGEPWRAAGARPSRHWADAYVSRPVVARCIARQVARSFVGDGNPALRGVSMEPTPGLEPTPSLRGLITCRQRTSPVTQSRVVPRSRL